MNALIGLTVLLLLGLSIMALRGLIFGAETFHPGEKRTYLFENEDGTKDNPFSDVTEGAQADNEKEWKYDPENV